MVGDFFWGEAQGEEDLFGDGCGIRVYSVCSRWVEIVYILRVERRLVDVSEVSGRSGFQDKELSNV